VGEEADEAAAEGGRPRSPAPFAGKASNHKIALKVQPRAVKIVRAGYSDFGPTLATEYLAEQHDIAVGKETLRQWMIEDGIWKPKRAKVEKVHVWRPRRSCLGELVPWDTSEHDWLEGRGEKLYLIAMVDDATSRGLARLVRHDSTEENMRMIWKYVERWGRCLGYYADKAGLFYNTPKANHHKDAPELGPTQIGRALQEMGIELIAAHSPQAKGRIERFLGTPQDRLVKGLRKAGARGRKRLIATWRMCICRCGTSVSRRKRGTRPTPIGRY
jgi:hypothetical protein